MSSLITCFFKDEEFFGRFFIGDKGFEFGNFNREELQEILWKIAEDKGALPDEREKLLSETKDADSGKSLFDSAKRAVPLLQQADKEEIWGKTLMDYAIKSQEREKTNGTREIRPIVETVYSALYDIDTNYATGFAERKVDPETGKIIDRPPKEDSTESTEDIK